MRNFDLNNKIPDNKFDYLELLKSDDIWIVKFHIQQKLHRKQKVGAREI